MLKGVAASVRGNLTSLGKLVSLIPERLWANKWDLLEDAPKSLMIASAFSFGIYAESLLGSLIFGPIFPNVSAYATMKWFFMGLGGLSALGISALALQGHYDWKNFKGFLKIFTAALAHHLQYYSGLELGLPLAQTIANTALMGAAVMWGNELLGVLTQSLPPQPPQPVEGSSNEPENHNEAPRSRSASRRAVTPGFDAHRASVSQSSSRSSTSEHAEPESSPRRSQRNR